MSTDAHDASTANRADPVAGAGSIGRGQVGSTGADARPVRPLERRMVRLAEEGLDSTAIAARFKRSAAHVERVLGLARLPGREWGTHPVGRGLRPLERRLLKSRADGITSDVLGARFRRSPEHILRVQALADHKVAVGWDAS
jgi:hypothetical protein